MKSSERLNTLNSLNSTELSTKILKSAGLTTNDISALIKNGVIKHVKRGSYELVVKDEPTPSLEVEENKPLVTYELLCDSIFNGDYENSTKYLTKLYETETNPEVIKKLNLYTYLLSFITTLPASLVPYTINQDMPINKGLEDAIILIRSKKFHQALIKLRQVEDKENELIKVSTTLLDTISTKITNITEGVTLNVSKGDLLTAKELLEQAPDLLYNNMKIQLHLVNIILSNEIPEINHNERSYNFTDAIKNNDFKTALKFHSNFISKKDMDNNTTTILLRKIIDLINHEKQKQSVKAPVKEIPKPLSHKELLRQQRIAEARKNLSKEPVTEPIPVPEVVKEVPITKEVKEESTKEELQVLTTEDSKVDILTILTKLMSNNNEFANTLLKTFLKELQKEEYEFLIIDLIKISYLEKDYSFLKPISTLAFISRDKFTFNLGEYIEEFYMNLANNNFEIAYLYLDIIENAKKLGITFDFISNLRMILKTSKEKYEQEYGDLKLSI